MYDVKAMMSLGKCLQIQIIYKRYFLGTTFKLCFSLQPQNKVAFFSLTAKKAAYDDTFKVFASIKNSKVKRLLVCKILAL